MNDPAVTQAATAVERMRAYGGRLFRIDQHLGRFAHSVDVLGIRGLPDGSAIAGLIDELIARNTPWTDQNVDFGVVIFASPGVATATKEHSPTLVIDLYPIDSDAMQERMTVGQAIVLTDVQQPSAACWPRDVKVRSRLHYYLADRQAQDHSPGALGVVLDADGSVTETSIANLLIVENGMIVSPRDAQILPGISLALVRGIAAEAGIGWRHAAIMPDRLRAADEVLLTGTSCGIWFANSIDGVPAAKNRPVYRRLRAGFDKVCGRT